MAAGNNQPPSKAVASIPDKPFPPHQPSKTTTTSPSPVNGSPSQSALSPAAPRVNGTQNDKADKEKAKQKDRKDHKNKKGSENSAPPTPEIPDTTTTAPLAAGDGSTPTPEIPSDDVKSPVDQGSSGVRTPKTGKPPRNPWTIFMRMTPHLQVTETEIRDFFGEAKVGITRVNIPHVFVGKAKIAYVEFGDEDAMRAGLDKHEVVRTSIQVFRYRLIIWDIFVVVA